MIRSLSDLEISGTFSSMTSTACFHLSGQNTASTGTVIVAACTYTCIYESPSSDPSAHAF
jgi:hypothetical protein